MMGLQGIWPGWQMPISMMPFPLHIGRTHQLMGLARLLPAFGGPTLPAEITALQTALDTPQRPVVAVVGGAKISSKLAVLDFLTDKVDCLILGGGMANTFLAAGGVDMQASLMEPDLFETARDILTKADARGCHILLPEDGLAATSFGANVPHRAVANAALAENEMVLDIGPASIKAAAAQIQKAATLLWNGPLGAFEYPPLIQRLLRWPASQQSRQARARWSASRAAVIRWPPSIACRGSRPAFLYVAGWRGVSGMAGRSCASCRVLLNRAGAE